MNLLNESKLEIIENLKKCLFYNSEFAQLEICLFKKIIVFKYKKEPRQERYTLEYDKIHL